MIGGRTKASSSASRTVAVAGILMLNNAVPSGFLPQEDQGAFFMEVQLPQGASTNRTVGTAA
ncbi:MAG: efflux RND transporter permease subunit, partial [Dongiaceae bacterium]